MSKNVVILNGLSIQIFALILKLNPNKLSEKRY